MRIRLRAPEGAFVITLPDDAIVNDLLSQITEKTSIKTFDVKYGYPPKPLQLTPGQTLSKLDIKLNGEQLTISPREEDLLPVAQNAPLSKATKATQSPESFSFTGLTDSAQPSKNTRAKAPVSLQRKVMEGEVPELPLPDRGATLGSFSLPAS